MKAVVAIAVACTGLSLWADCAHSSERVEVAEGRVIFEEAAVSADAMVNFDNWHASATTVPDFKRPWGFLLRRQREEWAEGMWTLVQDGSGGIAARASFTLSHDVSKANFCGVRVYFEYDRYAGAAWEADAGRSGVLPENRKRAGLFTGRITRFTVTPKGSARPVVVTFQEPTLVHLSNDSAWCGRFSLRIMRTGDIASGTTVTNSFVLSAPGRKLECGLRPPFKVVAGQEWVPMTMKKGVAAGSVADFSGFGLVDAPAGKYGWLVRKGNHFEFEKRPGKRVRFCGVNFVGSCCCPSAAEADELIDRIIRSGYNTIRLHHFDAPGCIPSAKDPTRTTFDPVMMDRFDAFVAKCISRGIYLTIDLYSLRRVPWRGIGYDRDGDIMFQQMKALIHITDAGFENWKAYAGNFLNHVNPYTGRAYKDEPGIPLICMVNEGALTQSWGYIKGTPELDRAWGRGDTSKLRTYGNPEFEKFCVDVEAKSYARMKAFVRGTGAEALLTDINNGPHFPLKNEFREKSFDYFDNHTYIDHPAWLGERLRLPSRQRGCSVLEYEESNFDALERWRIPSMPYTISEWNMCGPCAFRSQGGLYMGALAAKGGWDGLWRFTYAHSLPNLFDKSKAGPGYFDVMLDPIQQANDKAFVCLYFRGDAAEGVDSLKRGMDGSFTVDTPKTQGGFAAAGGTVEASMLRARLDGADATVCASAVDAAPSIESSRRILVTWLTDVQSTGVAWTGPDRKILKSRGCLPLLARAGSAEISLRLDNPSCYEVWACETDGARASRVSSCVRGGRLTFVAEIVSGRPVHMLYEVVLTRKGMP